MPRVDRTPPKLKPYKFHGMLLEVGDKNSTTDCLWCGGSDKLAILNETGVWNCLSCGEKGNVYSILSRILSLSIGKTENYEELLTHRGLLFPESLIQWEICKSYLNGFWLVPGYNVDGRLTQVYRYQSLNGTMKLLATPELPHQLFGVPLYDSTKPQTYICEGPWDGLALWELVSGEANVIAVPGANVFKPDWSKLFVDSDVTILFDNDHPRNDKPGAGIIGAEKVAGLLAGATSVTYLNWGEKGYDPRLPSGYDLRDSLSGRDLSSRREALGEILAKVEEVPEKWSRAAEDRSTGGDQIPKLECQECSDYRTMIRAWRKAMKWTPGLDHALTAMLASVASTKVVGDQLWLKIIGPAGCGKTTVAQGISVARNFVSTRDTLRGFTSGWKDENGEVCDLASEIDGKTMMTMDGDTLIQSPGLPIILSEARRLYDGYLNSHFKNRTGKDIFHHRFTWVILGTSSLRFMDASELGERFLDVVIMEGIDDELEDEILWRVANRVDRAMSQDGSSDTTSTHEPALALAMSLTGGYVEWLRKNASNLLTVTETPEWVLRKMTRFGKFVAFMRARPSDKQEENAEREFAARLVSQLLRLSKCLAIVLNRSEVDEEVVRRTRQVALDTSRGNTLEIVSQLAAVGIMGSETRPIAIAVHQGPERTTKLLRFLGKIGVVESFKPIGKRGMAQKVRWRLTEKMVSLRSELFED